MEMKFVPNLRSKFVADDGREFDLPVVWTEEKFHTGKWSSIFESSTLDRKQCKQLWQWLGRTDPVPNRLTIFVNWEDVERIEAQTKKDQPP